MHARGAGDRVYCSPTASPTPTPRHDRVLPLPSSLRAAVVGLFLGEAQNCLLLGPSETERGTVGHPQGRRARQLGWGHGSDPTGMRAFRVMGTPWALSCGRGGSSSEHILDPGRSCLPHPKPQAPRDQQPQSPPLGLPVAGVTPLLEKWLQAWGLLVLIDALIKVQL